MARRCDKWKDKMRVFLSPPGWRPAALGGPVVPSAQDRSTYRKFDNAVPRSTNVLVVGQFLLLLAVTTYFLFLGDTQPRWAQWAVAAVIVWWVMNLGLLLDEVRWAHVSEIVRALVLMALTLLLATDLPQILVPCVIGMMALPNVLALTRHRSGMQATRDTV